MKSLLTILFIGVCSHSIAQSSYRKMTFEGPVNTKYIINETSYTFDSRYMTYEENITSGVFFLALTGIALYGGTVSKGPFTELAILYGAAATFRLTQARRIKKRNSYLY